MMPLNNLLANGERNYRQLKRERDHIYLTDLTDLIRDVRADRSKHARIEIACDKAEAALKRE